LALSSLHYSFWSTLILYHIILTSVDLLTISGSYFLF
jgi:hypothetical protein